MRKTKHGNALYGHIPTGQLVSTYWDTSMEFSGVIREKKTYVRHDNNAEITETWTDGKLTETKTTYDGHP